MDTRATGWGNNCIQFKLSHKHEVAEGGRGPGSKPGPVVLSTTQFYEAYDHGWLASTAEGDSVINATLLYFSILL